MIILPFSCLGYIISLTSPIRTRFRELLPICTGDADRAGGSSLRTEPNVTVRLALCTGLLLIAMARGGHISILHRDLMDLPSSPKRRI